jgi:hypothetical protein
MMVGLVGVGAVLPGAAYGQLPPGRAVVYELHEVPSDPQSAVVFTITFALTALEQDGNWIGWEITSASFQQPGTGRRWTQSLPFVATTDGLWWVEHADPTAPDTGEFVDAPLLYGTAWNENGAGPDLNFDLAGHAAAGAGPYTNTAMLDYSFSTTALVEEDPPPSGDDDPTDVPEPPNDPWTHG